MPLTGTGNTLGTAIKDALVGAGYAVEDGDTDAIWQEIGTVIVAHIVANALVTTISGAPNSEHTGIIT